MNGLSANVLPLNPDQASSLESAVAGLSADQLNWVSGYAAGLAAANSNDSLTTGTVAPAAVTSPEEKLLVLFGSQTGNGEAVAEALSNQANEIGFAAEAVSLADFKPAALKRETLVTFVISTHGEGDPPDDAELFHEYLLSAKAPKLTNLKYSVLALGDSSYVNYCQTGREFDARLAELGAERLNAIVECDLDYESAAATWQSSILAQLPELLGSTPAGAAPQLRAVDSVPEYSKYKPFSAEVLTNQKITGGGSSKDVRHIELSLEGSGLTYSPGDALAVVAHNPPQLVAQIVDELSLNPDAVIAVGDDALPLGEALSSRLEVTRLNLGFLKTWSEVADSADLRNILASDDMTALSRFVDNYQIVDVVREFPASVSESQFVAMLRTLSPRSYSIASSLAANPDEVHLTVSKVSYDAFDSHHWGAASSYLSDVADVGSNVSVFVEPNNRFRLPAPNVPVVMIGPGTGVAPFRAFLEERVATGASGENWLFFGDRNFESDFLYQIEWQRYLKQGHLTKLSVAFSRDQKQKIYVQDRLRESGAELLRWIESGAALYVCGDASQMAGDVHAALIDVLGEHAGLDTDAAEDFLRELRASGRYQKDVY